MHGHVITAMKGIPQSSTPSAPFHAFTAKEM